ncbi:MAG: PD40 domain-containing protein, partial [Verrucomicrobiae bacterium]|nr:PD40 domain-containing protein [Verrucomicrobiae bacterium]
MTPNSTLMRLTSIIASLLFPAVLAFGMENESGLPDEVSYHQHVRPIFQEKCHGCHQPARSKADYIMTDVASLMAGGEGGEAVVIPHKPEESYLIDLVTLQPGDDRPEMPEKDEPLTPYELALVTRWIEQGAKDDTPENARQRFDQEHPPQYAVAPVITSLDFSPDGELLAIAGFHEVLLHKADGSGLVARLIGLSERIESARFSPDGTMLAVAGGLPGRMGEIQVWDVEKQKLKFSKPVGYDTAYGASWSPDGKYLAYGM